MENACHEKARRCLIRLFRNNFRREDILPHLFTVYNNAGQPENFLKLLCEFSPESLQKPSVIMLFAEAFYQAGDAEKALLYFRQIPTHSSYGVQSVFRTAQCLLQLNRKVEALEQFESLKNNETKPEGYHYFAGLNYFLLHRLKSAVKHLDLSCELNEYTVESLSRLVECALLNQNIDNAVHYYLRLSALCFAPESLKRLCASKLLSPEKLIEMIHPALDKLIDNFPENDCQQILSNYIQALCKASQAEKAAAVLEYMLEKKPEYLELLARKNGKDINIFLPLLRLGEKIQPQNSFFNLNLARLYFEQGMSKEALEYYQKAKQLFTENAPDMTEKLIFHRNCAALYFRNNQLPEARNHIEKALDIAPSDTDLLAKLSYLCYKQNDLKGRSLADQRLFFIKPDDPAVSFRLLEWYLGLNDQQNAIIHLKNYLKFYPEDREKINLLAKLSAQCNMFSQEIHAYEMLEKLPGKMERDHFLKKGNAWLSLGKELKAAPCFQQYLSENPENTGLRFQLARIYKKQQLWEKARFTLLEILKIEPFNATVQFELCEVLFTEKKYDAAAEQLSKLLRNKPYHTEAHYLLARICYEKGDYRQAVSSLDKVMENENNHEQARSLLARIFKSEGLWPEATREFETLYARTKKPEYLMELGVLHIKSGRRESALKNFRAICKSEPNNSKLSRLAEQFLKCSNR
jgi:tetratricopeptide (TPR) repeat protein